MTIAKLRMKLILIEIASFLVGIAPLVITLMIKWNSYTTQGKTSTVKLLFGGILIVGLIALSAIGKLKIHGRLVADVVILCLLWLMKPMVADISLILTMDLIGAFLDKVLFSRIINSYREKIANEKQADTTAEKVEEVLKNAGIISSEGRV